MQGPLGYSLRQDKSVQSHGTLRLEAETIDFSPEELEPGALQLLVEAANSNPPVRPEDVTTFFLFKDLDFDRTHGYVVDAGEHGMLVVPEPENLGSIVWHEGRAISAILFHPGAVARVDPDAPPHWATTLPAYKPKKKDWAKIRSERRARALLFRYLTREQKWELRAHRRFTVQGQDGETYRVYRWVGGNVFQVKEDKEVKTFCVVTAPEQGWVPVHDLLLVHKMLLEQNIQLFLSTAKTWVAEPLADRLARAFNEPLPGDMALEIVAEEVIEWLDREEAGVL